MPDNQSTELAFEEFDQKVFDFALLSVALDLLFGEDQLTVEKHVEHTRILGRRDRHSTRQELVELFEYVFRQPGGSLGVASLSAVVNRDRCAVLGGHKLGPPVRNRHFALQTAISASHPTARVSSTQGLPSALSCGRQLAINRVAHSGAPATLLEPSPSASQERGTGSCASESRKRRAICCKTQLLTGCLPL